MEEIKMNNTNTANTTSNLFDDWDPTAMELPEINYSFNVDTLELTADVHQPPSTGEKILKGALKAAAVGAVAVGAVEIYKHKEDIAYAAGKAANAVKKVFRRDEDESDLILDDDDIAMMSDEDIEAMSDEDLDKILEEEEIEEVEEGGEVNADEEEAF